MQNSCVSAVERVAWLNETVFNVEEKGEREKEKNEREKKRNAWSETRNIKEDLRVLLSVGQRLVYEILCAQRQTEREKSRVRGCCTRWKQAKAEKREEKREKERRNLLQIPLMSTVQNDVAKVIWIGWNVKWEHDKTDVYPRSYGEWIKETAKSQKPIWDKRETSTIK